MRLLIVTQAVDREDPVLGFFVRWIEEFAKHLERVEVICLKEGIHALPPNIHIHSLGKEHGAANRAAYVRHFLSLVWRLRHDYDVVFVHMNQEYVLVAGPLWKFLGKRVYLWYNHYAGSWLTDIAAAFCTKIFCTSKHSYTAKFKKTVIMPVGVDTERFFPNASVARKPHSILFLARMAPSKRPEMLVDALAKLARDNVEFSASFVGSPLQQDTASYEDLKAKVRSLSLADRISFYPGVPNGETSDLYRAHEIFVNCSPSGMFDKTLFEAAASGCRVFAASADFKALAGTEFSFASATELAERLKVSLAVSTHARSAMPQKLVEDNTLARLADRLSAAL
ncbi:glycosyltransferase family 4 protein [Candidatus Parcubacteria bacterium]|nr:glycosyltransferase family 4 protein [Candidatus Parcubacteria bacterium]